MPPPIKVDLVAHDPQWAALARAEAERISAAAGSCVVAVHHIGSTSIPGIHAKPVLDLLPVVRDLDAFDACRPAIEALGYEWWGEYGLPGRRYCTKSDPQSGQRLAQAHCYLEGSPEVIRHLAFRDYLRANADTAAEYDRLKQACRDAHPDDSHAYSDCKDGWIKRIEAQALQEYRPALKSIPCGQ